MYTQLRGLLHTRAIGSWNRDKAVFRFEKFTILVCMLISCRYWIDDRWDDPWWPVMSMAEGSEGARAGKSTLCALLPLTYQLQRWRPTVERAGHCGGRAAKPPAKSDLNRACAETVPPRMIISWIYWWRITTVDITAHREVQVHTLETISIAQLELMAKRLSADDDKRTISFGSLISIFYFTKCLSIFDSKRPQYLNAQVGCEALTMF